MLCFLQCSMVQLHGNRLTCIDWGSISLWQIARWRIRPCIRSMHQVGGTKPIKTISDSNQTMSTNDIELGARSWMGLKQHQVLYRDLGSSYLLGWFIINSFTFIRFMNHRINCWRKCNYILIYQNYTYRGK